MANKKTNVRNVRVPKKEVQGEQEPTVEEELVEEEQELNEQPTEKEEQLQPVEEEEEQGVDEQSSNEDTKNTKQLVDLGNGAFGVKFQNKWLIRGVSKEKALIFYNK